MLSGKVGDEIFGHLRYITQQFYHSAEWIEVHDHVVLRDNGCDLGVPGQKIKGSIYVHHMNPATLRQFIDHDPILLDPEYLISCSYNTHQAITWGNWDLIPKPFVERRPGDTCPWK